MDDMELLQCLIETEIAKLNYARQIAREKGQKNKLKALTHQVLGLKKSIKFIAEIQEMEE